MRNYIVGTRCDRAHNVALAVICTSTRVSHRERVKTKMAFQLSEGALSTIMGGGQVESPIMQILGVRKMSGSGATARHRLLISDGLHVNTYAMLAIQLNDKIANGELADYTVIQISRYISSIVPNSDKRVMILLDINVVAPGVEIGQRLGNPQPLNPDGEPSQSTAAHATHAVSGVLPTAARIPPSILREPGEQNTQRSGSMLPSTIWPIPSLMPFTKIWAIKGRITRKSNISSWSSGNRKGNLFSFDILDKFGEIRVSAFKEQCDQFYDIIEVGKVYVIFRGIVKAANSQYSSLNNDYEVSLYSDSQIVPVFEDSPEIPAASFMSEPLSAISKKESNVRVDIIGICQNVGMLVTFTARTSNKELMKRELTLVDKSLVSVVLTLWGKEAEDFSGEGQPVILVKGGVVNEYNGAKSVSAFTSSSVLINPDIPEAHKLRGWYDNEGKKINYKTVSQRTAGSDAKLVPLATIKTLQENLDDAAAYINCKATLVIIKSDKCMYYACPNGNCNKKVVDLNNGLYRCAKCNQEYSEYSPRFLLSMDVADYSAHEWVTCFHDVAKEILGHSASELYDLQNKDPKEFQRIFEDATYTSYVMRLRAQKQTYNDEPRLKVTVISAKPIDYAAYAKTLIEEIRELYEKA